MHDKRKRFFGKLDNVSGTTANTGQKQQFSPYSTSSFGYAGEMEDANGLVYLRARYYNHDTGTFVSPDPYEGTPDQPMSLNGYMYADGNPVNNTDPSGMVVCSDVTESPTS